MPTLLTDYILKGKLKSTYPSGALVRLLFVDFVGLQTLVLESFNNMETSEKVSLGENAQLFSATHA